MSRSLLVCSFFLCCFSFSAYGQLRIVTSEEPPTNYTVDGRLTGITTDIVRELMKRLNLNVGIEVMPWARSYRIAKSQSNVVIFTAGKTQSRIEHGFYFVGPVVTRKHLLWSRKGSNYRIKEPQDIPKLNLVMGGMAGDWRTKYFLDRGVAVQTVPNHQQNLLMLLRGRIDLWISSDIEALSITKALALDISKLERAFLIKEASSYIMLSKGTPQEAVDQWQQAFADLRKTDFFNKLATKWADILGYDIKYSPDRGLFLPYTH